MKRIAALVLLTVLLCGCDDAEKIVEPDRFVEIERVFISSRQIGDIVYDPETGVEYYVSYSAYNDGCLTLLVDAEGKPLIYQGEEE